MSSERPLEGLTVVAIEQAVAMPLCSARLADAGARVIKIERPEGDFARGYDEAAHGLSSYFVWLNRGKESLVLDLTCADDRGRLSELLGTADVFVQNLKPGALEKLGFSIEYLLETYPNLICCTITGYGDDGPMAHRKAYDLLVQAESGLASLTGSEAEPSRVGISMVDIATGTTAHAAVLEALIRRSLGFGGADIRISMFDVVAEWLTVPLLHAEAGQAPSRVGLKHPSIAPYGVFATKEGRQVLISVQNDREWGALCRHVLMRPDLIAEPDLATNVQRVRNRSATDAAVGEAFAGLEMEALVAALEKADIAFAEVNDMHGLSVHPHLRRITVQSPVGDVAYPAPPVIIKGESRRYGAVPALGENQV